MLSGLSCKPSPRSPHPFKQVLETTFPFFKPLSHPIHVLPYYQIYYFTWNLFSSSKQCNLLWPEVGISLTRAFFHLAKPICFFRMPYFLFSDWWTQSHLGIPILRRLLTLFYVPCSCWKWTSGKMEYQIGNKQWHSLIYWMDWIN